MFENPDNGKDQDEEEEFPGRSGFFSWFEFERNAVGDVIGDYIKDELWPSPMQYYFNTEPDSDEELLDEEDSQEDEDEEVDEEGDEYDDGEGEGDDGDDKE